MTEPHVPGTHHDGSGTQHDTASQNDPGTHHDTGTGWPDQPAAPAEPVVAGDPAELVVVGDPAELVVAGERAVREWDVDGPDTGTGEEVDDSATPASAKQRISATSAVIGLLLVLFGFVFVAQLRSHATGPTLASARPEDLVRILSDLDARKDRLSREINQLQTTQQQLAAGSQGRAAALAAADKRARDLGVLAGTLAAQGRGIQVQIVSGVRDLRAAVILDAVEELRDAGAEALQIEASGQSIRIVASTWFLDGPNGGLLVDGRLLSGTYLLTAIGDPPTMQTALNIPGGVVDTVRSAGGNVIVQQPGTVRVSALHQAGTPHYAQPAN